MPQRFAARKSCDKRAASHGPHRRAHRSFLIAAWLSAKHDETN
jgi:hypothetical protein